MAHRKGKSARGKSRVSQAPIPTTEELLATLDRAGVTTFRATGHCPLCVAFGVELGPYGHVDVTEKAAVRPVQPDTVT